MVNKDVIVWHFSQQEKFKAVVKIARLVIDSPPRSAQLVRLVSKLKEKIEELDRI